MDLHRIAAVAAGIAISQGLDKEKTVRLMHGHCGSYELFLLMGKVIKQQG